MARAGPLALGRDFALYWSATLASNLGSGVSLIALPLLAISQLHASGGAVGALRAAETAPYVVLALAAGFLADRTPRHRLMVAADLIRAALTGAIPALAAAGALSLPLLIALAAAVGSCTVLFDVAQFSLLGQLASDDRLVRANREVELVRGGSAVLGPSLGGLLVAALRASGAVLVDAASYLVSAALLARVRVRPAPRGAPSHGLPSARERQALTAGLRAVMGSRYLRPMTLYVGLNNLLNQAFMTAVVVFLALQLRLGATSVGLVFGAYGAGFLAGAVAAPRAGRVLGLGGACCLSSVVAGLGILTVATVPPAPGGPEVALTMLGTALVGLSGPPFNVQSVTLRLTVTPRDLLGRVNAAVKLVSQGAVPAGAALGGWLVTAAGARATFAALGAASLAATGILAFSAVRPLRRAPGPPSSRARLRPL